MAAQGRPRRNAEEAAVSADLRGIGLGVEQAGEVRPVRQLDLDNPAFAVGILVDEGRVVLQALVELGHEVSIDGRGRSERSG